MQINVQTRFEHFDNNAILHSDKLSKRMFTFLRILSMRLSLYTAG